MTEKNQDGFVEHFLEGLRQQGSDTALCWRYQDFSRDYLAELIESEYERLVEAGIEAGDCVVLLGDYAPVTVALLMALIWRNAIVAPLLPATLESNPDLIDIANPSHIVEISPESDIKIRSREASETHPHFETLRQRGAPGLVLFTSGSTGNPKGVIHDFGRLLNKFRVPRSALISLNFLLFDHWGGLNTLLHCLSSGSPVVLPERRTPDHICDLIERHGVELLPATPSFINLLLISKAFEGKDLSSLRLITYGAEPMPESTLKNLRQIMPNVETRQTYGLIELGVLRAKSKSSDSLWVKLGGEGYDIRVVDDMLQIKAEAAMLGYLNAPSPFTDDGYFMTGDRVEVDGEYYRVLGRDSELINVGGSKVYPAEVEAVLLNAEGVNDAVVYGEANPIMGNIVCADVRLSEGLDEKESRKAIKKFCRANLAAFMVPVRITFVSEKLHSDRFKRQRRR